MSNSGKASASADIKGANAGVKDRIILTTERVLCYIVLILITFLCLFSFYVLIINTTRSHPDIQKGFSFLPGKSFIVNMKNVLANENIPVIKGMFNSLFVAACSAVLSVYFSALTAFAIHAYNFRLKKFAFTFILLVMMVPTQVSALGFVKMIGDWKLLNSYIPLIVPSIAAPVVFFFIKQYMDSVLPMELIEAARIDGLSEFKIFLTIFMPTMKSTYAAALTVTFMNAWNNYLWPKVIMMSDTSQTMPMLVANLSVGYSIDYGVLMLGVLICSLPTGILFLVLQKSFANGIVGAVKG